MIISDGINHGKLQSIIVGELKKAGLKHRLKKIILKSSKDHKTVFGAPLPKVPSCNVICCGSTLCIPNAVSEMSVVLRSNANIEGLFRKAGSQSRQKDLKRLLDAGGCVSEGHHPIDVASVLKLYLRCLPEPLISTEVQDLLLRCRLTTGNALKPILHTLLLLPVLHVHLLHYIMELLNFIASQHKNNLMDSSNLAIVMTPSIMPLPAAATAQRLEHHVALVKIFIENSQHIGLLTDDILVQLDVDSDVCLARRKKRRSGSLNRMLSGLRKMVSGSVNTPATVKEIGQTPIMTKSAAKRKYNGYEGFSAKTKRVITEKLPQKELSFTPKKMGITERKRLRLSQMDLRSPPVIKDFSRKNSETSVSSEDAITSSDRLFSAHDTIDLSPDMQQSNKDYVRISKQEYEEIKSRVSAIETRLSREFTDVIPKVEPLQQVQNVYQQTLEDVAMLHCPTSDHLARRLSKELKIRPNEETKIIRSPSARKIGSIRRRSKENNVAKVIRHKSWNVPSLSQGSQNIDRFYPYIGLSRRDRVGNKQETIVASKNKQTKNWNDSQSDSSINVSDSSQKYRLRKRISLTSDYNLNKSVGKVQPRRSLNISANGYDRTTLENSVDNTFNSSIKSNESLDKSRFYHNNGKDSNKTKSLSPSKSHTKWRSAAAFFMDKTGEMDSNIQTGRPSVNKLRRQNAGAVLAKTKLFESSSDKSSEKPEQIQHAGFARKPRVNGQNRYQKNLTCNKLKSQFDGEIIKDLQRTSQDDVMLRRSSNLIAQSPRQTAPQSKEDMDSWRPSTRTTPPIKKHALPQGHFTKIHSTTPTLKKSLHPSRGIRTPASNTELRKGNTPLKAVHISPRRRSPRLKMLRNCNQVI